MEEGRECFGEDLWRGREIFYNMFGRASTLPNSSTHENLYSTLLYSSLAYPNLLLSSLVYPNRGQTR